MKPISPNEAFYIKLGFQGSWEHECIVVKQTIRLGFLEANHEDCLTSHWAKVRKIYLKSKSKGKATETANQIQSFYESDETALWVTFFANRMWWCFAAPRVRKLSDGTKVRRVIGRWRDTDINGRALSLDSLSGKLTQVRGFRGTICSLKERDYAIERINGKTSGEVLKATRAKESLEKQLIPLIQNLTWRDFEVFVDLLFVGSGWKRVGVLGKTEKAWDLDLIAPVTGDRAKVQVKSTASEKELADSVSEFRNLKGYQRMFFVVHTLHGKMRRQRASSRIVVLTPKELSERAVDAGLSNWLIRKNS